MDSRSSHTEHVVSTDGTTIGYWVSGSGPSLLLVHGTTADHQRWDTVLPLLESHFTIAAMDRRGRGESGDAPDYATAREAEDIAAVVDALPAPVNVLAHSYGALCSLEASLLTNVIARLVLYEPPIPVGEPTVPREILDRMTSLVNQGKYEATLEVMFREVVQMPEYELSAYRKLPMWQRRIQLAPTLVREISADRTYGFDAGRFASMQVPTLLLLGGDSPAHVRRQTETVDAALPNSHIVVLEGQQHIAMDLDPEGFVDEVVSFLTQ